MPQGAWIPNLHSTNSSFTPLESPPTSPTLNDHDHDLPRYNLPEFQVQHPQPVLSPSASRPRGGEAGYEKVPFHSRPIRTMEVETPDYKRGPALATRIEKMYMAVAAFQAIVVISIAFAVFGLVERLNLNKVRVTSENAKTRTVPVYLAIFIFAQLFSLVYSFDALRARNIAQLVLHLVFQTCILTYSILQIPQTRNALEGANLPSVCVQTATGFDCTGPGSLYSLLQKLMIVPPVVLGICGLAMLYLVRALYIEFGWAVFHLVGASPQMKMMHIQYQTLVSLLKLLTFFGTAFCMAYVILISSETQGKTEFVITIIALPMSFIALLLCGWALRVENKPLMGTCLFLMVAGLAYFIYKLASMFLPSTEGLYNDTKITMAIFSIFAVLILLVTFVNGCLCMSNFGKGLIQTHLNPENRTSLWSIQTTAKAKEADAEEAPVDNRLVID